ncbi:MAG: phosphate ABC transporter substrate-binding protein [Nitrospirota bacterium]|nr:phosphate ABC transporter substrate-binding protein [Nitrospirota bacterium]
MFKKVMAVLALLFVTTAGVAGADDELSYSGSSTIGMSVLDAGAVKAFETKTGVKFKSIEQPGSGKGIQALLDGKVTLAGVSRTLKQEEKNKKLLGTAIGYDAIAVFVHKNNSVKNLTKEQIKGIFAGKIKNWKEVGGKDAPIKPNTEIAGQKRATMLAFQEMAMDNSEYGSGFKEIDLPRDQIVDVAKNEDAICSVSFGLLAAVPSDLRSNVKAVTINGVEPSDKNIQSGAYLISRPLLLVTNGLPKGNVKKFIDFMLSAEGQKIVNINFVPVKK